MKNELGRAPSATTNDEKDIKVYKALENPLFTF
jgi:hypothetical protein